ncbi:MAG: dockerin type I domain-containing protein, partial [Ignavibacteria bacterium]
AGGFRAWDGIPLTQQLDLTMFIEGFYNSGSNAMTEDTVTVYLRNNSSPYAVTDSSKAFVNSSGQGTFIFSNAVNGVNYFIQLKHRNSIETWSKTAQQFTASALSYNFSTANTQAFGDNLIQVDTSPIRFAIYGGDVNQDGTVDATDVSTIDNDASNFVSGYVVTDLTGDEFVDGTDFAIADNNAANFVSAITP